MLAEDEDDDARKELENFAPSTKTLRSPSKGIFAQPVPPAPKKPATRAITAAEEEDDEDEATSTPSTSPTYPSPRLYSTYLFLTRCCVVALALGAYFGSHGDGTWKLTTIANATAQNARI